MSVSEGGKEKGKGGNVYESVCKCIYMYRCVYVYIYICVCMRA